MTYTPRTRTEIFNEMLQLKTGYSSLDVFTDQSINSEQTLFSKLTSTTIVSVWILWIHIVSIAIWLNQNSLKTGISEMEDIRNTGNYGNAKSLEYHIKKFQTNDEVSVNENGEILYTNYNEANQIIEFSSAVGLPGAALIKVRRKDTDILSEIEYNQAQTYQNQIGVLGISYLIENSAPDKLKLYGRIVYKGEKNLATLKTQVQDTINNYIKNVSFSSDFIKNDFIKTLLQIDGVIDFEITDIQARSDAGNFSGQIVYRYNSTAGYLKIDDNHPLNTSLSYVIQNIY